MTRKIEQFIKGMGSVIDIGASSAHIDLNVTLQPYLARTHAQALSGDWQKLAKDFDSAFKKTVGGSGYDVKPF